MKGLAIVVSLIALAGCAREDEADLPAACEVGAEVFVEALAAAPDPVRVEGVPISDCLAKDSTSGDVQAIGSALLETAQRLGEERDALALGYLVGAARRGAERSQGIHDEIVRRLEQEAGALRRAGAFGRGERAGRTSG